MVVDLTVPVVVSSVFLLGMSHLISRLPKSSIFYLTTKFLRPSKFLHPASATLSPAKRALFKGQNSHAAPETELLCTNCYTQQIERFKRYSLSNFTRPIVQVTNIYPNFHLMSSELDCINADVFVSTTKLLKIFRRVLETNEFNLQKPFFDLYISGNLNKSHFQLSFLLYQKEEFSDKRVDSEKAFSYILKKLNQLGVESSIAIAEQKIVRFHMMFPLSNPRCETQRAPVQYPSSLSQKKRLQIVGGNGMFTAVLNTQLSHKFSLEHFENSQDLLKKGLGETPGIILIYFSEDMPEFTQLINTVNMQKTRQELLLILGGCPADKRQKLYRLGADFVFGEDAEDAEITAFLANLYDTQVRHQNRIQEAIVEYEISASEDCIEYEFSRSDYKFMQMFNQVIEDNYQTSDFSVVACASLLAITEKTLQRRIKKIYNSNFRCFLREYRMDRAKVLLKKGYNVTATSLSVGLMSPAYFTKTFRSHFGYTPSQYLQKSQESSQRNNEK